LTGLGLAVPIADHLDLLGGDQRAAHHAPDGRHEPVDRILVFDDLDHQRQILREAQHLGRVQTARMAEAHRSAQNGRAGEAHFARLEHDRLVKRLTARLVVLADEDAEQHGVPGERHGQTHFMALMESASMWPSQTATRQSTTEPTTLPPTWSHSPSLARLSVWRLNEEKVVKPPRIPVMTNWRVVVPANMRPSGPVSGAKKPIMNEPSTFTNSVPQGKSSPNSLA